MLKKTLAVLALAAAGAAAALAVARPAAAWTINDATGNGFNVQQVYSSGSSCAEVYIIGHGSPYTDLGSTCDPGFQAALDGFMGSWCPCAQTTAAATTAAPTTATATATTTTAAATTTAAPADTTTTTAAAPAAAPAPATTTVVSQAAPPAADFTSATVNPDVVAFTDTTVPGTAPVTSHTWQYGDGTAGTGPTPSHAYAGAGVYTVTLIAVDANGLTSIAVHTLTVAADGTSTLGPRQTQAARQTSVRRVGNRTVPDAVFWKIKGWAPPTG